MRIENGNRLPTVTPYGIYGFFGDYRFLSNFEAAPLVLSDGIRYPTSEHAYMALKTLDLELRREIAALSTPGKARRRGQEIQLREDWLEFRPQAMLLALRAKFSQNPALQELLLATAPLYLEETNNWGDVFWGCVDGKGLNMLGKTLIQVRTELLEQRRWDSLPAASVAQQGVGLAARGYGLSPLHPAVVELQTLRARLTVLEAERGRPVVAERGPWSADEDGRTLSSDDFTHDVLLRVSGDFGDDISRKAYSDELARRLNAGGAL